MNDYIFNTELPLSTNEITMTIFLDEEFYKVFNDECDIIMQDGTYAEVEDSEGILWGLQASGNGDFLSHRISFEKLS